MEYISSHTSSDAWDTDVRERREEGRIEHVLVSEETDDTTQSATDTKHDQNQNLEEITDIVQVEQQNQNARCESGSVEDLDEIRLSIWMSQRKDTGSMHLIPGARQ